MPGPFYYKRKPQAPLEGTVAWAQLEELHRNGHIGATAIICEETSELWFPYDAMAAAVQQYAPPQQKKGTAPSLGNTTLTVLLYLLSACGLFIFAAIVLSSETSALGGLLVAFVIMAIAAGLIVLALIVRRLDIIDKKLSQ